VNPRPAGRTAACTRIDAVRRHDHAEKFLEVAEIVDADSDDVPASANVAAALAVLAGIAASDAACCATLGRRSRGQDHRQAVELLREVSAGGPEVARRLQRLLDLKDSAHYGVITLSGEDLKTALRAARTLVEFSAAALRT
jgi:hypothetical protein